MQILLKATEKKIEIFCIVTKTPHEFTGLNIVIYTSSTNALVAWEFMEAINMKCTIFLFTCLDVLGHVLHSHARVRKCHSRFITSAIIDQVCLCTCGARVCGRRACVTCASRVALAHAHV